MDFDQDTSACDIASKYHAHITNDTANMRQYTKREVGEADDPSLTRSHTHRSFNGHAKCRANIL